MRASCNATDDARQEKVDSEGQRYSFAGASSYSCRANISRTEAWKTKVTWSLGHGHSIGLSDIARPNAAAGARAVSVSPAGAGAGAWAVACSATRGSHYYYRFVIHLLKGLAGTADYYTGHEVQ